MIGPENSCHSFNQSDAKLNPIMTWPPAFPALSAVLMVANDDLFCYTSLHQFLISFSCSMTSSLNCGLMIMCKKGTVNFPLEMSLITFMQFSFQ